MKNIYLALLLFYCFSCGTVAPIKVVPNSSTDFQENNSISEYYRQQRLRSFVKKTRINEKGELVEFLEPASSPIIHIKPKTYKTTRPSFRIPQRPAQDIEREIHQNLDYFCIKNVGQGKFQKQVECQNFTTKSLQLCQSSYQEISEGLLNCVKKELNAGL